ncbi:MAG TPA: Cof-type HAD-IIB family hydrolase [Candidatus Blautia intestinavium]|mgnify:FL=1|nr:Cof-type HAD-IIB family hydrolase [Candidatus Blautia intestinavium]
MAENTRILFTDLDGTLLNDKKEITPGNQEAINQALEAGHKVVISTGRPLASGLIIAERAGLVKEGCYIIAFNGGQIYDPFHKKTIFGKTLPRELAKNIFQDSIDRGLHIQSYSDTEVLVLKDDTEIQKYVQGTEMRYRVVKDLDAAFPMDPYKILAISFDDRPKIEKFQRETVDPLAGTVRSFFSNDAYLEIVPEGISKGFAIQWMCRYLDVPLENSVAAGDAENDVEMLETAHVGAVMCNAFPGVADHGDYVTEHDNNHDGLAEIVRKFILN